MESSTLKDLEEAICHVAVQIHHINGGGDFSDIGITSLLRPTGLIPKYEVKWRELEPVKLPDMIAYHIGHDLACNGNPLEEEGRCNALAHQIIALADADCRWFANHDADLDALRAGRYSWTPVSDWTFDACYVAVGERRSLCVCFQAED